MKGRDTLINQTGNINYSNITVTSCSGNSFLSVVLVLARWLYLVIQNVRENDGGHRTNTYLPDTTQPLAQINPPTLPQACTNGAH